MGGKDTNIIINSRNNSVNLSAKKDIILKTGGKVNLDAKGGIVYKNSTFDITKPEQKSSQADSVESEKKAADVRGTDEVRATITASPATAMRVEGVKDDGGEEKMYMKGKAEATVQEETKPKITKMYWTYWDGEKYRELENNKKNRYYIDLNLHVETKDYDDGEAIEIILEDDDGQPLFGDTLELKLSGSVYENKVMFANVFGEYTLNC
jgi:hypothetical protein